MCLVTFRLSLWLLISYFSGICTISVNNDSRCVDKGGLSPWSPRIGEIEKGTQRCERNGRICGYISPFCGGIEVGEYRTKKTGKSHFNKGIDKLNLLSSTEFESKQNINRRILECFLFFGSQTSIYTDATWEYEWETEKKRKEGKEDDDGEEEGVEEQPTEVGEVGSEDEELPLAPPCEDEPLETVEETTDLTRPPTFKNEWNLKRIAHGRDFWHRFFENPCESVQRACRWFKFTHDRFFCNKIVKRTVTEVHPLKTGELSKKDKRRQKSRFKITKETIGYDNTGKASNLLILLNYPREKLVRMVEVMRLPGLLDLRNYEMLNLLQHSMIYLSKLKMFRSFVEFMLSFGRLNLRDTADCDREPVAESTNIYQEIDGKRKYSPIKTIFRVGNRVMRPIIFAKIGYFEKDPFPKHLLIPRRAKEKPIREPFPTNEHKCSLNDFLDKCEYIIRERLKKATYNHDETMDRTFSDIFTDAPEYTTHESVNKIDYPTTFNFLDILKEHLVPERTKTGKAETTADHPFKWTAEDIKNMLKRIKELGLNPVESMIKRFRALHNELGFTYDEIIEIGKRAPAVFEHGNYRQCCLQIYDLDEEFTHDMVRKLVHSYPNLLGVNIARNIRPKVYYLTRNLCKSVSVLLSFPKFLSYSLYDRIIPRHISIMNKYYNGEFIRVYNYLFESGYYHGYGQMVTDEKVPDILPKGHSEHMEAYKTLMNQIGIREMVSTSDSKFCEIFGITYRNLVEGKVQAMKVRLPCDIF